MSFYFLFGMRIWNLFDCSLVERTISAGFHSLKDYAYFGMEEMAARYFKVQIDKQYQESFTLDAVLSDDQIAYAALDTRFPLALASGSNARILQGHTAKSLLQKERRREHPQEH